MNITYRLIGTTPYKKIKVRLYHNKLDISAGTDLLSKTDNWDFELEQYIIDPTTKKSSRILLEKSNDNLFALKNNIEEAFNSDFSSGVIINNQWLENIVKKTFLRPSQEEKLLNQPHTIFLDDFGLYWLKEQSLVWINSRSKTISNKAKSQKKKALEHFMEFEKKAKSKTRLVDFSTQKIKAFYDFLIAQEYAVSTAKKTLADLKFFCSRAKELKFDVNLDFEIEMAFKDTKTKYDVVYLNESEITTIFNHDFSENKTHDIIRDNFILSLWTGKRISDLKHVNFVNIIGENLESIDQKTGVLVKTALHPQVKVILNKYFQNLPPKVGKDQYNLEIKEICRICKIDAPVYGEVFDQEKGRKIAKYYPKYKLVTSHTARRSFATNLSKIMPLKDVARAGGWANEKMVIHYNKETASEVADRMQKIFNSEIN